MKDPKPPTGLSDPVSYTCTCNIQDPPGGLVLLFYRYFAASPSLPAEHVPAASTPSLLSTFHSSLTTSLNLTGKIRLSTEGFNVTVAGPTPAINAYIAACTSHWSFAALDLSTPALRRAFFKPSPGCACVFPGPARIRITAEITPMGVTDYAPRDWSGVTRLSPTEFHAACHDADAKTVLLDVRNHYESRIGYFVDPRTNEPATRPEIRRFAQWPAYARRWAGEGEGRTVMAYCTGGIRCEKATRWMVERAGMGEGERVCTLEGGIQGYLMWMEEEIAAGRKRVGESLFRGKNYVFDGRGSVGLEVGDQGKEDGRPVARCHGCGALEDRLSKCRSKGCHLVLVVCEECEEKDPRCCENCRELDVGRGEEDGPRPICLCEMERETRLWGEDYFTRAKTKGKKKGGREAVSLEVKAIQS